MGNSTFKEHIKPSLVLVLICLVVSVALSQVHSITLPLINAMAAKTADQTRTLVLPNATTFTSYEGTLQEGIIDFYWADNGAGAAITAEANSYGGPITVMIGVDAKGAVTGVKVMSHSDTPGLGTKAQTPEYLSQYEGKTAADLIADLETVGQDTIKDNTNLDAVTGATISSNGVYHAVQRALAQFEAAGGVKNE
ncbi:FMN-binding protein [Aminipila luticellarii]|uniref:Ion-translocating oxidoreductase complex subunit G n=1 Tax=Aminipila luticellarii TaxID=2507160 RepID=A0A410PYB4_9FIRM|nr:FMN-binding protein [Aminipila luticellarii]QAT43943.1 FMN-binding protein [Aminipila luticellarii]